MRRGILRRPAESTASTPGTEDSRFPGYDVLGEVERWDATTAGVVLSRLAPPPPIRFFSPDEEAVGRALFDQLLDQRDEPRVPILEMVDARLAEAMTDGWHHAELPEDGAAFRQSFAALDDDAKTAYGERFALLEWYDRADLVQSVHDADGDWHGLSAGYVWDLWTRYACTAFYSHPWAWNEIGFGGPAYPRGYKNLGINALEPWEVNDHADEDPIGRGAEIEQARRRHAEVRSHELRSRDPNGPKGVSDRLATPR
ncbi:MAG TPA: gluconate 2-dehydrogenase subunit 3 family protein [Mycobacteriales bacterium]|nr:gluconate 2-dehydrogenase subunit 3 family protein [Mycobacteriales bacterium]